MASWVVTLKVCNSKLNQNNYLGAQILKNEMGKTCGTYGEQERCILDCGGET